MALLEQHPEVVVFRPFEYEPRMARYWAEVFGTLCEPGSYRQALGAVEEYEPEWWTGKRHQLPPITLEDPEIEHWIGGHGVEAMARMCRGRIDAFYEQAAKMAGKQQPRYFAEKTLPETFSLHILPEFYQRTKQRVPGAGLPGHGVLDPRLRPAARLLGLRPGRGRHGRGVRAQPRPRRGPAGAELEASRRIGRPAALRGPDHRPPEGAWLAAVPARPSEQRDRGGAHAAARRPRTPPAAGSPIRRATTPAKSIGRWQTDLEPSLQAVCEEAFGEALEVFGYHEDLDRAKAASS